MIRRPPRSTLESSSAASDVYKRQPSINLWDTPEKYNGWNDWTTWNVALWIRNDECYYNIAKDCKDYMDFLFEMHSMIGSFATPDGADWGEANIEELNEVIFECN